MAQHDYIISNQTFPNTRQDINNLAEAVATNNSGTSAPTTQYAGQFWIDTTSTTWTLYIHDGTDDIQFATIDTSANTVNFTDSALDVVTDTTPQLGGDLDLNSSDITGTGNINITGTATVTGLTTTGDINLGDSDKINLGASNDLQIFHDGSNSYINEIGTGQLILAGEDVRITTPNAGEFMATFGVNGAVNLYYDNSKKFETTSTGIDVTGNATVSGDLTVDTNTLYVDSANNLVGIGTTSPSSLLEVQSATSPAIKVISNGYGSSANVTIDGGSSYDSSLVILGSGTPKYNLFRDGSQNDDFRMLSLTDTAGATDFLRYEINGSLKFSTSATEAMRIDSSGNVGIGTTSPTAPLHIYSASANRPLIESNSTSQAGLILKNTDREFRILNGSNSLSVYDTTSGSERMRIDSDGALLVNKTASNQGTVGLQVGGSGANVITQSNGDAFRINRLSSDGNVVLIMQDTSIEGIISVSGATVTYGGFTGSHWSRLIDNSKPTILKGTILESLDEMCDWYQVQFDITDEDGNTTTQKESYTLGDDESVGDVITYTYEETDYQATIIKENDVKHVKAKISDTVDAKNVYGVFSNWDEEDDTVNDMNVAQTGTFVVRMNSAETVSKGDLIQSNGDGTGKVQSDDIIRASTVAKVLSTTKIETYEDGSYIVPCSLHC